MRGPYLEILSPKLSSTDRACEVRALKLRAQYFTVRQEEPGLINSFLNGKNEYFPKTDRELADNVPKKFSRN